MSKLILGQWNALCDRCGFEFKSSELRKDWQGLMICAKDFEHRHPQDFIRVRPERVTPPWVRPDPPDTFLNPIFCSLQARQGKAGVGVAGCMISGRVTPF